MTYQKFNTRDVIVYPYRFSDCSKTGQEELGNFFLENICTHVLIPKKHNDIITLSCVPLNKLNDPNLGLSTDYNVNSDYIGEIELCATKIGELYNVYKFKCENLYWRINGTSLNVSDLNLFDVIDERYDGIDIVNGSTIEKMKLWVVVNTNDGLVVDIDYFKNHFKFFVMGGWQDLGKIKDLSCLEDMIEKNTAKYIKNLNPTLSQMTGKMISVWRVKLTL
jgi:hypothetical protein